eukprot:scaffold37310_cov54-Phaeocystis_antarctica.AAC.2
MMSLTCQGLASCAALAISAPIAFAAAHSELNSCGSSSRSCACEPAVARAESPHALSALRSSFFCSVPAPAPCCFAGGVAAGVGRVGGTGRRVLQYNWSGLLAERLLARPAGAIRTFHAHRRTFPPAPHERLCRDRGPRAHRRHRPDRKLDVLPSAEPLEKGRAH